MAMTEIQRPTSAANLYHELQNIGTEIDNIMARLRDARTYLDRIAAADLDAMGVPGTGATGPEREDLVALRTAVRELVDFYDGTATTQTEPPEDVFERVRRIR